MNESIESTSKKGVALYLLDKFQADREKLEHYSSIAERCPLPAFVAGPDRESILYLNPAYTALTGRTLDELQNGNWPLVIHPDDRDEVATIWKKFTESSTVEPHWHRYVHKNGTIVEAMTLVESVRESGYVGFILPQCGDETCPVRRLNATMWRTWSLTKDLFKTRVKSGSNQHSPAPAPESSRSG